MHRKVAAALVAALALGVASCGGSEALTREEVVSRIETACRQAQERTEQAARAVRDGGGFFTAVLAGQRQLTEKVEDLEGSDDISDELDTLKSGLAERAELVADVADAPRAEQQRALADIEARAEAATKRIEGALRGLGVRGCESV